MDIKGIKIENISDEEIDIIEEELIKFNTQKIRIAKSAFFKDIRKGIIKDGKVLAGISGFIELERALKIEIFWVHESLRGQNIGTRLLLEFENEAKEKGTEFSSLETFDFQAKAFYEKYGYKVFGQLEYKTGNTNYFLKKDL